MTPLIRLLQNLKYHLNSYLRCHSINDFSLVLFCLYLLSSHVVKNKFKLNPD